MFSNLEFILNQFDRKVLFPVSAEFHDFQCQLIWFTRDRFWSPHPRDLQEFGAFHPSYPVCLISTNLFLVIMYKLKFFVKEFDKLIKK